MSLCAVPPGPSGCHFRVPAFGCLVLACLLALAQTLLLLHEVNHLGHVDEEQCEICLAGAPLGAALRTAVHDFADRVSPHVPQLFAIVRPPLRWSCNAHRARAPPPGDGR